MNVITKAVAAVTASSAALVLTGALAAPAMALGGITVTAGPDPAVMGRPVIVSAQVAPAAAQFGGEYEFRVNDEAPVFVEASPGDAYGNLTYQTATPGTYDVGVAYTPDDASGNPNPMGQVMGSTSFTVTARPQQVMSPLTNVTPIQHAKSRVIARAGADETTAGQPVSFTVSSGAKKCAVRVKDNGAVVLKGKQPGTCTVKATAPGVDGQWAPYVQKRTYTIR